MGFEKECAIGALRHILSFFCSTRITSRCELVFSGSSFCRFQLEAATKSLLQRLRLDHTAVSAFGTPRRLVVLVSDLAVSQPDVTEEQRGPPAGKAYDSEGNPTKVRQRYEGLGMTSTFEAPIILRFLGRLKNLLLQVTQFLRHLNNGMKTSA